MGVNIDRSLIGDSIGRSIVFGAAVGGFVLAGAWLANLASFPNYNPGIFTMAFVLLTLLAVTTGLQAYYHGSTVLAFALILAGPFGVFLPSNPLLELPIWGYVLFGLPTAVTFFFGGLGHLIGAQFAIYYDASGNPSTMGQILIATATVGLLGLQILDNVINLPII